MANSFEVLIVGGGLAGSSLAIALARAGASVAVVEQEERFCDRVRGECVLPWGVAEARRLGLVETLEAAGAHFPAHIELYIGPNRIERRHLPTTTPQHEPMLSLYHPALHPRSVPRRSWP
jgi:menaquinone-9 beta-reductase